MELKNAWEREMELKNYGLMYTVFRLIDQRVVLDCGVCLDMEDFCIRLWGLFVVIYTVRKPRHLGSVSLFNLGQAVDDVYPKPTCHPSTPMCQLWFRKDSEAQHPQ